ncbi:MAG: ATP-binding cassette domain-containing protein [Proteobacteria bacterium]|nr:ATP-binding cassette domain-containing protein [Pseudomonadota bacterium]
MALPRSLNNLLLINEIKNIYILFKPYFGLSLSNFNRILSVGLIIFSSAVSALSFVYINEAFAAFNLLILSQNVTLTLMSYAILNCLTPIMVLAGTMTMAWFVTSWLSDNLRDELSKLLISKFMDDGSYYGIKFFNSKRKSINPAIVLGDDLGNVCSSSTTLASSFVQAFLNFCVGIYQLWLMSFPLVINIFSLTFALPGYIVLASLGYSLIYSLTINILDKNLSKIENKLKSKKDKLTGHLHHVVENSEAISLKRGNKNEKDGLLEYLSKLSAIQTSYRNIGSLINFVQNIGMNVSYMFGLILSAPGIISGKFDPSNTFSLAQYFTSVVNFFTWKKNNTTSLISFNVSLDRFNQFNNLMNEWDKIKSSEGLVFRTKQNTLSVKNLTVSTPNEEVIFYNANFNIPVGKATVIQGPSGIGKTTLFRCLAGLWPYVKGEIILPANSKTKETSIYYIPQQPYFPYNKTLLEAIFYPNVTSITAARRRKVIKLMREVGFDENVISNLDKKDEWNKKLSGGQQQRINIIGAIIKSPDVLFMDEGTNGLDVKTKQDCESALKKYLPNTTIVAIDHNSENTSYKPFFDYKLKVDKQPFTMKKGATVRLLKFSSKTVA